MFKDVEKEEDEDYELEKMAAVIKSKGGKMYRENLDDEEDDDEDNNTKNLNGKIPEKKIKSKQNGVDDDDETTDSDSESEISEAEDQSAAMPINEWDDKPVLTPAGKKNICLIVRTLFSYAMVFNRQKEEEEKRQSFR